MHAISLVKTIHAILLERIQKGEWVIDATLGKGQDTAFLVAAVGEAGRVFGFDIQAESLHHVQQRLRSSVLTLYQANHADLLQHLPTVAHGNIRACMFNLGYLPGGNQHIITHATSTLRALSAACQVLMPDGIVTIIAYPGHPGGAEECGAVTEFCQQLAREEFTVEIIVSHSTNPNAPVGFVLKKCGQPLRQHSINR
ncbi:MAG: 16S rRNA (cytosine(1402)-N(4))-methyltransferase [Methylococcaceae bacterium]|jgi:16S rRNA C1402 N4-methylase RsmH|nr:MAG: 16S rRNA (cytosine(1402)-N(4))-methyltransferase [Methylococcaceae bacterium]